MKAELYLQALRSCVLVIGVALLCSACAGSRGKSERNVVAVMPKGARILADKPVQPKPKAGAPLQVGVIDSLASFFGPELRPGDVVAPPPKVDHPIAPMVKNGRLVSANKSGELHFEVLERQDGRPDPGMFEDAAIASKTRGRFAARAELGRDRIQVTSDRGVVTLDGVLDSSEAVARAVDLTLGVPDVVAVRSRLKVLPPDPPQQG